MKHLPSFLTYYFNTQYDCKTSQRFCFFFSFHFLFFLDRWQVKVDISVKFPAEVDSLCMYILKRFDGVCTNYHSLAHPKKSQDFKETYLAV